MTIKTPRRLLVIFQILTISLIFLYSWDSLNKNVYMLSAGLVLLTFFSNIIVSKISSGDHYLILIVSMLMSIGVIMIYRISPELGLKQLLWLTIGIVIFFVSYFAIKWLSVWDKMLYLYILINYLFFAITFILGTRKHGAINWIEFKGISIQPGEFAKIVLVFIIAAYFANENYAKKIKHADKILMLIIYSFIGLFFIQRDLGTALVFFGIFTGLQFIYSKERYLIWVNIMGAVVGGIVGYFSFDHVKVRILTWINPWPYIDNKGYQITQSLFAISTGDYFGTGLGRGNPSFIPLSYNDFIFSAITEEMGVFTGIGIIMLFMLLTYRGFKIALKQRQMFYRILAIGISLMFGIQAFTIIAGVLKLIPLTGLTLPFVSYGGSSVITSFAALGILQGSSEKLEGRII
ncbi:MAG: FtsW/RodA/SpoVE family cell cycle protein [Tissierellia bacterium]|nr:FtsW/RodA/SpoVE family cell cycle protein [Tissierellia bacterium]